MTNPSRDVSMWLHTLNRHTQPTLSLFYTEFSNLKKLGPIEPVRVIKTRSGEPEIFFIDRLATIKLLKELYAFHTKEEAAEQLSGYMES